MDVKNLDLDKDSPTSLNLDPDSVKLNPKHGLRQYWNLIGNKAVLYKVRYIKIDQTLKKKESYPSSERYIQPHASQFLLCSVNPDTEWAGGRSC